VQRLNATLAALGRIGETPEGMQRVAFSPADVEGRRYVMDLMRQAGLAVRVDPAGNVIGRREGARRDAPAIALGSHVDTVPSGGKYDGALGVLAAIETARTLGDLDIATRHPLEVVVFANEEGTTFNRWLLGSRAMAGTWGDEDLGAADGEGVGIGDYLKRVGGDLVRVEEAARRRGELHAYLELHIEQGPVLHKAGIPIGVVSGITGRVVFLVHVKGTTNHAGTTPMDARRDALVAASRLTLAVNSIVTQEEACRVGTVGTVAIKPTSAVNVIPGEVELGVEFRDIDMASLGHAERRLREVAREVAAATGTDVRVQRLELGQSCPIGGDIQGVVARAAQRLCLGSTVIPSGAGHDAQAMANITQAGMIFVPSVNGISHSREEYTAPQDCANGANVLLNSLLLLDEG
jgi:N-carbamoyl-L-amino-acid hydrolase